MTTTRTNPTPMRLLTALLLLTAPCLLPAQEKTAKKIDFATQIWPILEKRCVECHAAPHTEGGRTKKPKGGVILDSKDGITSSKRGKVIVAGKPDDSLLLQSVTLPADDEDRMPPPKKGEPLSKTQTDLIKTWIEGGADFGKWTGKAEDDKDKKEQTDDKGDAEKKKEAGGDDPKPKSGGSTDKRKTKDDPMPKLASGLRPISEDTLANFANGPFRVEAAAPDSPLLVVTCAGHTDEVDDAAVRALLPLAEHVVELDLARSKVGDGACEVIGKMGRLLRLDLRQTGVGNGITALAACKELRSVNLFGTKVGDYGMAALAACKHLEHVYVWQTDVSPGATLRLREAVPDVRVVVAPDLPEPMTDAPAGRNRR